MISGYITTDIQTEGQKLGITVYLNKPFNLFTLFNGIMSAFGKEQQQITQQKRSDFLATENKIQLCDARVLVVEDDKINQIVALEILKCFGAEVVTIDNGTAAIDAVLGNDFDMVFMDIQMPGINGYEATAAIRQFKGELELPIIAMTAHAFGEERERCLAAGMNDHLAKPIDPDQLYSVMLNWLPVEKVKNALNIHKKTVFTDTRSDIQSADPDWIQLPNKELEPLIKQLGDSLNNNSLGAKKLYGQLKQYLSQPCRDEIRQHIDRLDFEKALSALERAADSLGISYERGV